MKRASLKPRIQACYLHGGFLILAVCLLLASVGLAQLADTRIAFMSTRSDDNGEIFLMNPDGKRVRRLTQHPQYDAAPAWSPDGKKITYTSFRGKPKPRGELYVMNADGTNPINLTQSPKIREDVSSWSPNGKQIAFRALDIFKGGSPSDIWVMDVDGGNPRNLTNHHAGDWGPDWSPDGLQIAFTSDRNSHWEFDPWEWNSEIYVMAPDGANLINLTNHPAKDSNAAWSPDGNQITFTSNRDGNLEIYVMNADGTNPIRLTQNRNRDKSPSWGSTPVLSVSPKERLATLWGTVKRAQ